MATKPSKFLDWVTDGSVSKIYEPPTPLKNSGWVAGEAPPFDYMNWLFYMADQWIKYFEEIVNYDATTLNLDQTTRLIEGGFFSWNLATGTLTWDAAMQIAIPSLPDANNNIAAGSIVLTDGQVAYVAANIPFTTTATTTNGSAVLTAVDYINGIVPGQTVYGTGIPGSTTVLSVNVANSTVTLSANATASGSLVNITFSGVGALTVIAATASTLAPTPNMIILARRSGTVVYLGVNSGQMVLRDGESKRLLRNGFAGVTDIVAGEDLTARTLVYISNASDTGGRTAGRVYKLDPGVTNGAVRSGYFGYVMTDVLSGATAKIVTGGVLPGFSGLSPGVQYYGNPSTPGAYTATRPTLATQYTVPVGLAITSTSMLIESQGQYFSFTDNSVTTPKIADLAVTPSKLLNDFGQVGRNTVVSDWVGNTTLYKPFNLSTSNINAICWSPSLKIFVAVAGFNVIGKAYWSSNGIDWNQVSSAAAGNQIDVCWSPTLNLFCSVGVSSVQTSPDGLTWTSRTAAAAINWAKVCWSAELNLFVAVASSGTTNRVMTSPDGTTWTSRTTPNVAYRSVCWSPTLSLFVAGGASAIMTSPDGITWTARTTPLTGNALGVVWADSLGLFVMVTNGGTNRIATSPDGITWTARVSADDSMSWTDIEWSRELNLLVTTGGGTGGSYRIGYSKDGINWFHKVELYDPSVYGTGGMNDICWSAELGIFCGVYSGYGAVEQYSTQFAFFTSYRGVTNIAPIYRNLLQASGSHTAAKVTGTYAIPAGDPLAVSGTGTLYPIPLIYIDLMDFQPVNGIASMMRLSGQTISNSVSPAMSFTFGLYPVTVAAGAAGLATLTLGTVVTGSTFAATPGGAVAASKGQSADFAVPAAGFYCLGVIPSGTMPASSHVHVNAQLMVRTTA